MKIDILKILNGLEICFNWSQKVPTNKIWNQCVHWVRLFGVPKYTNFEQFFNIFTVFDAPLNPALYPIAAKICQLVHWFLAYFLCFLYWKRFGYLFLWLKLFGEKCVIWLAGWWQQSLCCCRCWPIHPHYIMELLCILALYSVYATMIPRFPKQVLSSVSNVTIFWYS